MELRVAIPEQHVSEDVLNPALEAVTRINERLISEGHAPTFEEGLKAGVRWRPEPHGQPESFDNAAVVMSRKGRWGGDSYEGDCDDLAPWAAASMRATGQDPDAKAVVRRSGPGNWHAYVERGDGSERDPSVEAGMGQGRVHGIGAAVVPYMFAPPAGVSGLGRPAIALRRIITPRGNVGFDARVDIPMSSTDMAVSTLERRRVASQAVIGAIMGACYASEAAGTGDVDHMSKLYAIAGILDGEDPRELVRVLGRSAVVGAIPFLQTMGSAVGSDVGFSFGKFLKVFEPLASTVVSFIPGVGPIAKGAMDLATSVITHQASPGQALQSALNMVGPNPVTNTIQDGLNLLQTGNPVTYSIYPNAHIAPQGT